jgi:hypothetical protein
MQSRSMWDTYDDVGSRRMQSTSVWEEYGDVDSKRTQSKSTWEEPDGVGPASAIFLSMLPVLTKVIGGDCVGMRPIYIQPRRRSGCGITQDGGSLSRRAHLSTGNMHPKLGGFSSNRQLSSARQDFDLQARPFDVFFPHNTTPRAPIVHSL